MDKMPDAWTDDLNDNFTPDSEFPVFMQYTGLKDKNGKEIYEGDIVEYDIDFQNKPFYDLRRVVIGFSYGSFLLLDPEDKAEEPGGFNAIYLHTPALCVVGNIYENLELISPSPANNA